MGAISMKEPTKNHAGIAEAGNGQVAIVTEDGRPLFLAVPYDEDLD